jgi:osmoprotectant transport system permease protein
MIEEVIDWFQTTPDIWTTILEHMKLSYLPVLGAMVVAMPVGLWIGHYRRFEFLAVTAAGLGRAIPSFAIVALALPISIALGLGLGFWPTFAALFFLALPPIVTNTYIGVKSVDPDTVEAARGMGQNERQILTTIELPLASPLIVAGIRTAAVQSVATATLGALVAAGGLGEYITLGFRSGDDGALLGGAILVALLAIATEFVFTFIERAARPKGAPRTPSAVEPLDEISAYASKTGHPRPPTDMAAGA